MKRLKQSHVSEYRKEMLKDQGGNCAFCGQECKKPCLDHAHMDPYKDKVRGVLCNWCNIAIGKLENARVRTGTSWEDFEKSFPDVWEYIYDYDPLHDHEEGYSKADWHPSKRKSEVTEFRNLHVDEQWDVLKQMGADFKIVSNKEYRVALFKKLNNKT
tara:strand:- start:34 stop:507 length:474 start_codon:yes stop_codon:yes gene_type:complete